jgi:NitT/TauT family transport system substrate-binding protein
VEVRLVTVGEPDRAVANLLSGAADLAWSGPMRVIRDHARDAASPLVSFGAVVMRDPFLLMGRGPAPPGFTLRDLPRLRLGTVSEVPTPWWCLQDDLRRLGVDPAGVPAVHGRTMRENAEALATGTLDLAQLFEPFASELEARGVAQPWHAQAMRGPDLLHRLLWDRAPASRRGGRPAWGWCAASRAPSPGCAPRRRRGWRR